jgi:hypothetical protein
MRAGLIKFAAVVVCAALGMSFAFALTGGQTALRVIQTQTMLIRHKATEEQRRAAQNNAKVFFSQITPEKKQELKKKKVRAVLIRTTRSRETSPAAKDVRMRFSLEGESLIDDYAYEFSSPLQAGTIAQTAGLDPEYVGQ